MWSGKRGEAVGLRLKRGIWLAVLCCVAGRGARAQGLHLAESAPEVVEWTLTGAEAEPFAGAPAMPPGLLSGVVMDGSEAAIPGATISLHREGIDSVLQTVAGPEGAFALADVPAGRYELRVECAGFVPYTAAVEIAPGRQLETGELLLGAAAAESVEVQASSHDVAAAQVALEEQQRVLGVFPNFYASYAPDAEPLTVGQKYQLAWRFSNDPVAFIMAGAVAGVEQPNSFRGYGPGMTGYDKRFGAAYADGLVSTMVGQALLPALLHQDPRYFVKGTGSVGSRTLYALASTVMCKGDDKHWQVNYSNLLGNLAGAGASDLYYPAASRRGFVGVSQVALTSTALGAIGGLFQEFLLHRMTPHVPDYGEAR